MKFILEKWFLALLCFSSFIIQVIPIWTKRMENPNLFEGDIELDPDEKIYTGRDHAFSAIKGGKWPNKDIPYEVYTFTSTTMKKLIKKALEEYEKHTCLRFKSRTNEKAYIHFGGGLSCSSPLGYRKDRINRVSLPSGCGKIGIIMHEVAHSLGFYHEHARPDRDQFVKILFENVQPDMTYNFKKKSLKISDQLETPYDYLSIMHYGDKVFSRNGKITIQTKNAFFQKRIGNRQKFSDIDVRKINLRYCAEKTPVTTKKPFVTSSSNNCIDKYPSSCQNWKNQCSSNDVIQKICCYTCRLVQGCKDSSSSCDVWSKSGYCTIKTQLMRSLCAKTCNLCIL